ncbi:type IV secretory system conjugative DNA transfer family protein [Nocardia vulneris]|uniref:Type VI secretion protein n=1 Tax=Nocardia vulneris TaxID=1141657 RepID=A0ABR4Z6A9_9NOCA|nr:DUF87 domain-containing protein [Nocardia vulneris]KIA60841.1 type VI secretion protein [Nocardia vulneris]
MTTAPPAEHGWLGRLLLDPDHTLGRLLDDLARSVGEPSGAMVAGAAVGVLAAVVLAQRYRRRRLTAGAREVIVLTPPVVEPGSAAAFWSHLLGLLRPRWRRVLLGQPHLGFEYRVTAEAGVSIRLWVPRAIPPGLIERAVESAWPGARTRAAATATPPLPEPASRKRRLLVGGELRLARNHGLPIRTDYSGDLVRDLITAAADLDPGQAACVQVLARPVTSHRLRRASTHLPGQSLTLVQTVLRDLLDLLTPGAPARPRYRARNGDRQAAMQETASTRAAVAKARGGHWETRLRYAVTTTLDEDADSETVAQARAVARGRAHALAAVFGACTDLNYYRRHRHLRLATALTERRLARGDLLSIPELAAIAHLPFDPTVAGVARAGARALAPATIIATSGPHTKPLGIADAGSGQRPVALRVADARHHVHILGSTGVGKSTLLAQLVLDDATHHRGVVVIDPKGDLVTDILDRLPARHGERVVLFDADSPTPPPCVNPLDTTRGEVDLAVDNLIAIFARIYSRHWGPRTDDVLRTSLLTLCAQHDTATLADLPRLLTEPALRARLTATTTDPVLRGFWRSYDTLSDAGRAEIIAPLLNKLRAFLLRPFVKAALAAGPSTVSLPEILDHGGICLARLPKGSLGEETTRLVGSLLVARTWQAATSRARTPTTSRPDAALVLDEAHNFLNLSTPVEDMLAEARGLRLSLVLAHQNLAQLPRELRDAVSANARNKVIFTASPEDARELSRHTSPWLGEHDLIHLDAFHAAARLVTNGQQAPPFTLITQPLPPPIPGNPRGIRATTRSHSSTTAPPGPSLRSPATPRHHDPRR